MQLKIITRRDFSGGPAVRTVPPVEGAWVWSLVRELKSHTPLGASQKKNLFKLSQEEIAQK